MLFWTNVSFYGKVGGMTGERQVAITEPEVNLMSSEGVGEQILANQIMLDSIDLTLRGYQSKAIHSTDTKNVQAVLTSASTILDRVEKTHKKMHSLTEDIKAQQEYIVYLKAKLDKLYILYK